MRCWLALCLLFSGIAVAGETVSICHGYGCQSLAEIYYDDGQLASVGEKLGAAEDGETERATLADVIGELYGWAGLQSDIHNDRGGNYADGTVPGKMDCIDHATSTTRLLLLLENLGLLRWHRVVAPELRHWAWVIPAHYSAVIEEKMAGEVGRFAVDSWFVDNGQPAVILPLDEWKKGAGPDV